MAGTSPRATFIILLKRRDPEIVKQFTVVSRGKVDGRVGG